MSIAKIMRFYREILNFKLTNDNSRDGRKHLHIHLTYRNFKLYALDISQFKKYLIQICNNVLIQVYNRIPLLTCFLFGLEIKKEPKKIN